MTGRELAVVRGWADTRATLREWQRSPLAVLAPWAAVSAAVAAVLLAAVWAAAHVVPADTWPHVIAGVHRPATVGDAASIVGRNLLVLALHALACLAGFIARSSLPLEAEDHTGWLRRVHDRAGDLAMAFVAGATLFSLGTQALALGGILATLSWQLDSSPAFVLLTMALHALPELTALFLPLAAWLLAARAGAYEQLLAATLVTTAIALPVVVLSAVVEVTVTPEVIRALHFV